MNELNNQLVNIIKIGRRIENRSVSFALGKLLEEGGELSEAAHTKMGLLTSKELKHPDQVYEEALDVIIVALDVVGKVYKKELDDGVLTEEDLINNIFKWTDIKMNKWKEKEGIK